jgi:site-specific recombinase XerD
MKNRPAASGRNRPAASVRERPAASRPSLPIPAGSVSLPDAARMWLGDGKSQGWSHRTLEDRRKALERFCWWLETEAETPPDTAALTPLQIRAFLSYARDPQPTGRYGSNRPAAKREARPATVNAYYRILRAFANFCLAEGLLEKNPLKNVKAPRIPNDQLQPLNREQLQLLIDVARRGRAPDRDVAMLQLLVDSGLRASELCGLRVRDLDRGAGKLWVTGKGNKRRQVYMGTTTRRSLWRYLETNRRDALGEEPLFASIGGTQSGAALTANGVHRVVAKAGRMAGLSGASPHALRRSFAINFLRGGGNLLELQALMGHEDLTVLRRYVALAEMDLAEAHRAASPVDRMKLR